MKINNISSKETSRVILNSASRKIWKICRFILLVGLEFMLLYPILFMIVTAFRDRVDMSDPSIVWITRTWTFDNIAALFKAIDYPSLLSYTMQITVISAFFQVIVCGLVGYGFARFEFPFKKLLFAIVIFTIIIPPQTYLTPIFMMFRHFKIPVISQLLSAINPELASFNFIDTPIPFWLQSFFGMGLRSGLFIFIFRQFFRGLPRELEDAAAIDGCGHLKTYLRVMLPNAVSAIMTVLIFSVVWHWNDYFMPSMLSLSRQTIATSLATIRDTVGRQITEGGGDELLVQVRVQAGALLAMAPMLILFVVAQRYFTEGIERTGIVG